MSCRALGLGTLVLLSISMFLLQAWPDAACNGQQLAGGQKGVSASSPTLSMFCMCLCRSQTWIWGWVGHKGATGFGPLTPTLLWIGRVTP